MKKERLISMADVLGRICISRTQLYRLIKQGKFPRQVAVSTYKIAFLESEIDDWIAGCANMRKCSEGWAQRSFRASHAARGRKKD